MDCLKESLNHLKLEYVDFYLVQYPKPTYYDNNDTRNTDVRKQVWREMEQAVGMFCSPIRNRSSLLSNFRNARSVLSTVRVETRCLINVFLLAERSGAKRSKFTFAYI